MSENTSTTVLRGRIDTEAPLVDDVVHGCFDFKGRPVLFAKSSCWKSTSFIVGVEMAERFANYGISSDRINYLTGPLGQSTAAANGQERHRFRRRFISKHIPHELLLPLCSTSCVQP